VEVDVSQKIYEKGFEALKAAMLAATIKGSNPPEALFSRVLITDAYPLPEREGEIPEPFKRLSLSMDDPDYLRGVISFTQTYESTSQTSLDDEDGIEIAGTYQIDIFARGGMKELRSRLVSFFLSSYQVELDGVRLSWDARNGFEGGVETSLDSYSCLGFNYFLDWTIIKTI